METIEKHEKEIKDKETSTALLNHIKEKKSEKIRQRQEKFDQRKKRDEDRRKAKGGLFLLCSETNWWSLYFLAQIKTHMLSKLEA